MDTIGSLYEGHFYKYSITANLLAQDDESAGNNQFLLSSYLQAGTSYTLVITTFSQRVTGPFSITATGPGSLMFLPRNTSTPMSSTWSMFNTTAVYPGWSKSSDFCNHTARFPLTLQWRIRAHESFL